MEVEYLVPFRSKAQVAKFRLLVKRGEITQATFDEWMRATPNPKRLPTRVQKK